MEAGRGFCLRPALGSGCGAPQRSSCAVSLLRGVAATIMLGAATAPRLAEAQEGPDPASILEGIERSLSAQAEASLAVLGLSVIPSETASTLQLDTGQDGAASYVGGQLGGAFTLSESVPLFLEGWLGYARYDPSVVTGDGRSFEFPGRWTGASATGGIGWDLRLTDELVFRPIANLSLGHVENDLSVLGRVIEAETGLDLPPFRDGRVTVVGYGGSAMLEFSRSRPTHEIDVTLRYTAIQLQAVNETNVEFDRSSEAQTLALWSRTRLPTGLSIGPMPLRSVWEASMGLYLGDQEKVLDSPWLGQVGAGAELGFEEVSWSPISRGRLVARFVFGENATGVSIGLGASF